MKIALGFLLPKVKIHKPSVIGLVACDLPHPHKVMIAGNHDFL